jgi:signal transduction histidine kinase
MTPFGGSKSSPAKGRLTPSRPALLGGLVLAIACVGYAIFDQASVKRETERRLTTELRDAHKHLRSVVSTIVLNSYFTSSIETANYAESMHEIMPFHDSSIADSVVLYHVDGTIYADATRPGLFGREDALSVVARRAASSDKTLVDVAEREGKLYLYATGRVTSLNGVVGVVAVGQEIGAILAKAATDVSFRLTRIEVVRANEPERYSDRWSFTQIPGYRLPDGWEIRATTPVRTWALLVDAAATLLLLALYTAFAALWLRYRAAEDNLREEEVRRVSSDRLVALGQMSAGIAHEINSPLAVIQMGSEQLKVLFADEGLPKDLAAEGSVICDRIERTSKRISGIISGLRTFARDGSKDPMEEARVHEIVRETLEICSARLKYGRIEVRLNLGDREDVVRCRSVQISQVILNLVNNAYDAIEKSENPWIAFDLYRGQTFLELWITDSGPGIPEEVRKKIMEPFFTTKPVGKGTGMGLSIAQGIMESHGGALYVDSTCRNTRFVIRLPLPEAQTGAAA